MTDKIHYRVKTYRLNDKTSERLEEGKDKFGKSWNLFFVELLNKYEQKKTKKSR